MTALLLARRCFLLSAFALFWMKDPLLVGGLPIFPADLLFLMSGLLWTVVVLTTARLDWNRGFWPLLAYFAALSLSAAFSPDLRTSLLKLATQAYLLGIPVLAYQLIESVDDLRRIFAAYLAGAAIVAALGVATVLLFPFLGYGALLDWPFHSFGTLPPGPYPRIETSFEYPAMMANYLTLALMLVLVGRRLGWLRRSVALPLGGGIVISALFALTPGFGGLLFMVGLWVWHQRRGTLFGRASLAAGCAIAAAEILVAAITPVIHPTAPFLIMAPGMTEPLAPAVRLLAWIDAWRNFVAHPLVGLGIGRDAVHVPYLNPSGAFGIVTDAHNMVLSIAAQAGILGLAGMLTVVTFAVREMLRGRLIVFGLALAFLSCLLIQGFVGAFEDARHIWLAYGLMLVADRSSGETMNQVSEPAAKR